MQVLKFLLRFAFSFILVFSLLFLIGNAPALGKKIKSRVIKKPANAFLPIVNTQTFSESNTAFLPNIAKDTLFIPALGIKAPILYSDSADEAELLSLLKEGVVHIADTALPGSIGNAVIVGHSSAYVWDRSQKYGTVFATLDRLKENDLIWIRTSEGLFAYSVVNKIIVKPSAVEILSPTKDATLTLFTCYPVGTTKNRLVVQAKLFYPEKPLPSFAEKPSLPSLPRIR